jgi:CheY-like chemotaxis protein
VLIVERDDALRRSLVAAIDAAGYATTPSDGHELAAILDRTTFDVAVVETQMPSAGWTILRSGRGRESASFVARTSHEEVVALIETRCPPQTIEERAKVIAKLYVAPGCPRSARASKIVAAVVSAFDPDEIDCEVIDVTNAPTAPAAPSLVLERPLRLTLPSGPTSAAFLLSLFSIAEVQRRRG